MRRYACSVNFEYFASSSSPTALEHLADRLRSLPAVGARFQGLAEAGYKKRPKIMIDGELTNHELREALLSALSECLEAPQSDA